MPLIKIKVEWEGSNKVLNLDRSKPNLYDRLIMELEQKIEEDFLLFSGVLIISDESSLVAAIEDCINAKQAFLQLTARPNKSKKSAPSAPVVTSAPTTPAKPVVSTPSKPVAETPSKPVAETPSKPAQISSSATTTPSKPTTGSKFCPTCGTATNGAKFCPNCGEKMEVAATAPVVEPKKPEPSKEQPKKEEPKQEIKQEKPKTTSSGPITQKGDKDHCGKCGKEVSSGVIALDRIWHNECFVCSECGEQFGGEHKLMEIDGNPVCSLCYVANHVPRCETCGKPLDGQYVVVEGKNYHPECFVCSSCGGPIQGSYMIKNGKIVCKSCA